MKFSMSPKVDLPGDHNGFQHRHRLHLLGTFELRMDDRVVDVPASAQRVLALVAFQRRPIHRLHLAGLLWPDVPEDRAKANLRSALWRLNSCTSTVIRRVQGQLALSEDTTVDVHQLADRATRLLHSHEQVTEADLECAGLDVELLPDWYEEWLVPEREHLRQLRLHALEALGYRLVELHRLAEAVLVALDAVHADPLRESAHRLLIEVHLAEGNRSEAVRQQRRYARLLYTELGIAPSPAFEALLPVEPSITPMAG
ncbi:MAG TPA: BTAD domain-containing putative transcriptional regulator [Acidimicrobiales bacterium]|nr:BTAD domain-containing putative transcriptional regulator [Acidimicrobiales bacterium]